MTADGARYFGGRYRVDGILGRGGMGQVFHGYDERLDRRVAIKVLRQSRSVPNPPTTPGEAEIAEDLDRDRKRFLREIRTTARLELAGAPAVYDTGVEPGPDGVHELWVVMQLLHGTTLEAVLDAADFDADPPTIAWAAAIGAQLAAVLADVHRVDVVHRDLKPANVMLVDGGLVKLLDFGIAILRGAGALPRLTQVDRTIGTPPYMSPEQCLGIVVTAASDVYSLGCLLVEMLTGDLPFHGTADTPLRVHHLRTPAPAVRERRPEIPEDLARLVATMLAKEPTRRPTASQVYAGLLPHTATAGDPAVDTDGRDPLRPFRSPLLSPVSDTEDRDELPPLSDAEYDDLVARAVALLDADRPDQAVEVLEEGVARTVGRPFLHLRLRHMLAGALVEAGRPARAAPLFVAVAQEYRRFTTTPPEVLVDLAYQAGYAYAELGRAQDALPHLRLAVGRTDTVSAPDAVDARFLIAQLLGGLGEPDRAIEELDELRPRLVTRWGERATQVRTLDRLRERLQEL